MNLAQDEPGAAIANFKKALSINPKHVEASENLGALYVAGGDYGRALPLLETAYRAKRSASSGVNYAIALRNAKKYPEAEQVYQDVIKSSPRDVNAQLNYALLLIDYMSKPKDGLALVYKVKFLETEKRDVVALSNVLEQKAKGEPKGETKGENKE
jgi:tetratricopeptide (TPR) repeat protein